MSYQGNLATENNKGMLRCFGGCVTCMLSTILFIVFIFNAVGLAIGASNQNATCYVNQNTISLSLWLIVTCSVAMVVIAILFILVIVVTCEIFNNDGMSAFCATIPGILLLGCSTLFSIAMVIVGIIELHYQFASCIHEVKSICVMTIIVVIANLMFVFTKCCVISGKAGISKTSGYAEV